MKWNQCLMLGAILISVTCAYGHAEKTIDVHLLTDDVKEHGIGKKIGTITFEDSDKGLVIRTELKDLPPGNHGFHIHVNPSCNGLEKDGKWMPGEAAGGHLDPARTNKHLGPEGKGHLGDLPYLVVDKKGNNQTTTIAHRLTLKEILGHSIMIHVGGDTYKDVPPMGGGDGRLACGVIKG